MFKKKFVFSFICITIFMSLSLFAQYNIDWTIENCECFIGFEDTDGDGFKELVFTGDNNISIVDPITGTSEWDSGYGVTFYSVPLAFPKLIDIDNDGVYEILFRSGNSFKLIKYTGSASVPNSIGEYKQILHQNYPNPFNPETTINYQLKKSGFVELKIYNIKGQLVQTLVKDEQSAGNHSIVWNAKEISSGQYFYQISIDDKAVQTKKAIFLK